MSVRSPIAWFNALDIASRAATLSLGSNIVLMVAKIAVGLAFGSIAVLGDGIDSAQDVFASGLAFLAVRLAMTPADEEHPFGHGKAEGLAALAQAALITGGAAFIAGTAVYRLVTERVEVTVAPSLVMMLVTVAVNLSVAAYAMRAARISGSVAIASDARHLLTNVVQAGAIIAALVLVGITGNEVFDPLVALGLAAYLLWIAFRIARSAIAELYDEALPRHELALVEACFADPHDGVRGFHGLRTRKSGREKYIDVHMLVDPAMTVSDAHRRIEDIERHIVEGIPDAVVNIHIDPDEPGIMERTHASTASDTPAPLPVHRH